MNRKRFLQICGMITAGTFTGIPKILGSSMNNLYDSSKLEVPMYVNHLNNKILRFNNNHKFKIVQFTDTHYAAGDERSLPSIACQNLVLDVERPDFVIYTGDLIFGKPAEKSFDEVLSPVIKRNIPFSVVWGNHDEEFGLTRKECFEYIKKFPHNFTSTQKDISGFSNYVLTVKNAVNQDAAILYGIDSNAYFKDTKISEYDFVHDDQIQWYLKETKRLTGQNGGNPIPALAFFHIPTPEFAEASGNNNAFLIGIRKEEVCSPTINSGLIAAFLQGKDVMGVFVGHDHVNDYLVDYKGIALCYGHYSGGRTVYHDIPDGNGARVIELTEGKHTFKTWIRLSSGIAKCPIEYPECLSKDIW